MSNPLESNRFAYATLVTGHDYLIGATALAKSIRACGSQYPLLVLTTRDTHDVRALEAFGAQVIEIEPLDVSDAFRARHSKEEIHGKNPFIKGKKPSFHTPLDNFDKLRLWQLTDYDRLVFLDADTLMLRPCDKLFAYPEFSAAPNLYEDLQDFHRMNSGVFVAQPSQDTFNQMMATLDAPEAFWRRTDQTFLETFFEDWHGLPYSYNCLQYVYFNLPELWSWDKIKLVHYQYEKPWQSDHPKKDQLSPLIDLWWHVYDTGTLPALPS